MVGEQSLDAIGSSSSLIVKRGIGRGGRVPLVEGPLLGRGHRLLADLLLQHLRQVQDGEARPRVVVLRAESGAGKSRIVREVYERLRQGQPLDANGDGYWPSLPSTISGPGGYGERMPVRKRVGPDPAGFQRPPGAVPAFAWWSLTCERREGGDLLDVNLELGRQLQAHARFLVYSWRQKTEPQDRFQAWLSNEWPTLAEKGLTHSGVDVVGALLAATGVFVPGVGAAADIAVGAGRRWWRDRLTKKRVTQGGSLDDPLASAESLYLQLSRLAHPDLPMIVAVEDMHLMGPGLAALLSLMAQPNPTWPVLVIGTAWPGGEREPMYGDWIEGARTTRLAAGQSLAEVIDLAGLDPGSLGELLRRYAPATDDNTVGRVVEAWPNPYSLQLMLTDPGVSAVNIEDGRLRISDEEIAELPSSVEDFYRRRWHYMPEEVRLALMLAVGCQPAEAIDAPISWPFIRWVVAAAGASAGLLDDAKVIESLDHAADPYEWARITDAERDLEHIREWTLARVVVDHQKKDKRLRGSRLYEAASSELAAWITTQVESSGCFLDLADPLVGTVARWLLAITPSDDPTLATAVAALTAARANADAHQVASAVAILERSGFPKGLDDEAPDTLRSRNQLGRWLIDVGRAEDAIGLLRGLLDDCGRIPEPGHLLMEMVRSDLALAYRMVGLTHEAIELLEQVLPATEKALGPDDRSTWTAKSNLASAYESVGRTGEAIDLLEQVQSATEKALPPDHPDTSIALAHLAATYRKVGRTGEAIERLEQARSATKNRLGPDHPDTLFVAAALAEAYRSEYRSQEAIAVLEEVLDASERVLGSDHLRTLTVRNNLAAAYASAGRNQEAIAVLKQVLADRERVLGRDHVQTVIARSNLGFAWMSAPGLATDAVELLEEALAEAERVLGEDSPIALAAGDNLGAAYVRAGRLPESVATLERVLEAAEVVLGQDHPQAKSARRNLAFSIMAAERLGTVLPESELQRLRSKFRLYVPGPAE